MKRFLTLALGFGLWSQVATAETISYNVECWADGHEFRVNNESRKEYLTNSRLFLKIENSNDDVELSSYFGHVSGAKFVEGRDTMTRVDFYSQFLGKDLAASSAPKATTYPDDKYLRFKDFNASIETEQDGAGMNGYLVVSRKAISVTTRKQSFDAHYVFQHGDHTGGTIDFTCEN